MRLLSLPYHLGAGEELCRDPRGRISSLDGRFSWNTFLGGGVAYLPIAIIWNNCIYFKIFKDYIDIYKL